jgi:hypothetical protein
VTAQTCKEQLLYEIHDPAAYYTPDVIADFSQVQITEIGPDRVAVTGGRGRARPETLKTTLGYRDSFIGEGQISYAGPGAQARAQLAADIVRERLALTGVQTDELRLDLIGVNAISGAQMASAAFARATGSAPARGRAHGQHEGSDTHRQRGRNPLHQRPGWWRWRDQGRPRGHCRAIAAAAAQPGASIRSYRGGLTCNSEDIAHSRAGDKGDISNISVIAYRIEDYALLERELTAERVRAHFAGLCMERWCATPCRSWGRSIS